MHQSTIRTRATGLALAGAAAMVAAKQFPRAVADTTSHSWPTPSSMRSRDGSNVGRPIDRVKNLQRSINAARPATAAERANASFIKRHDRQKHAIGTLEHLGATRKTGYILRPAQIAALSPFDRNLYYVARDVYQRPVSR